MAGGRHRGRGRNNNRQRKQNKGPQTPPDERLWRRVTQHFGEEQWQQTWTGEGIAALMPIIAHVIEFLTELVQSGNILLSDDMKR